MAKEKQPFRIQVAQEGFYRLPLRCRVKVNEYVAAEDQVEAVSHLIRCLVQVEALKTDHALQRRLHPYEALLLVHTLKDKLAEHVGRDLAGLLQLVDAISRFG